MSLAEIQKSTRLRRALAPAVTQAGAEAAAASALKIDLSHQGALMAFKPVSVLGDHPGGWAVSPKVSGNHPAFGNGGKGGAGAGAGAGGAADV